MRKLGRSCVGGLCGNPVLAFKTWRREGNVHLGGGCVVGVLGSNSVEALRPQNGALWNIVKMGLNFLFGCRKY